MTRIDKYYFQSVSWDFFDLDTKPDCTYKLYDWFKTKTSGQDWRRKEEGQRSSTRASVYGIL